MKRRKTGFTLSEALIVMSILGIVAAMAIPQVIYNSQKARNGSILGKTVAQVENGCSNVLANANGVTEDGGTFTGFSGIKFSDLPNGGNSNNFLTGETMLENTSTRELFDVGDGLTAKDGVVATRLTGYSPTLYNGTGSIAGWSESIVVYPSIKTGAFIGIGNLESGQIDTGEAEPEVVVVDPDPIGGEPEPVVEVVEKNPILNIVFIDVNAEAKPNRLGKDIFIFGLTDRCNMLPAGSQRMRNKGYPASETDVCTDNDQGTGMACANRIVSDGYKINY